MLIPTLGIGRWEGSGTCTATALHLQIISHRQVWEPGVKVQTPITLGASTCRLCSVGMYYWFLASRTCLRGVDEDHYASLHIQISLEVAPTSVGRAFINVDARNLNAMRQLYAYFVRTPRTT